MNKSLNLTLDEHLKKSGILSSCDLENTIRALFILHQNDMIDDSGHRWGIGHIVETVGLTRKTYYEAIKSNTSPSKATLIRLAFAFNFEAEELSDLMYYNGYVFPAPATIEDEVIYLAFKVGISELKDIDSLLMEYSADPCYTFSSA